MISQIVLKSLRKTAENGYFWGTARFYVCPEENRLLLSKSLWRQFFVIFSFLAHTSFSAFQLARLLHTWNSNTGNIDAQYEIFLEYICLVYLIPPLCCQLYFLGREETFATFVNQFLTYYRSTEGHKE